MLQQGSDCMTIENINLIEFKDNRGINAKIYDDNVSDLVEIIYDNGTKRKITRDHYRRKKDDLSSLVSSISAVEYIGKKYFDKTGKYECEIISVVRHRKSYIASLVTVKWETGVETTHTLNKVKFSKISYQRAINKKSDSDPIIRIKTVSSRFGGKMVLPNGVSYVFTHSSCIAKWRAMMLRCYGNNQEKAYDKIYVCDDWKNFYNFYEWYEKHYRVGWVLDKDLKHGDYYSPETCVLIPERLNAMLITRTETDDLPISMYKTTLIGRKPYVASVNLHTNKINLDYHDNVIDGFIRVRIIKEYILNKVCQMIFANQPHDEQISEILLLCSNFKLIDKRPNGITEEELVLYLQKETKSSSQDYHRLKKKYIQINQEYYNQKFNQINSILQNEL